MKPVRLANDVHRDLKVFAAELGDTMSNALRKIFNEYKKIKDKKP